jgi:hypothetical protein
MGSKDLRFDNGHVSCLVSNEQTVLIRAFGLMLLLLIG